MIFSKILDQVKKVVKIFKRDTIKTKIGVEASLSNEMSAAITLWSEMYAGRAPWVTGNVKSMMLPAAIASELARLTTLEIKSQISGSARAEFLDAAYQPVLGDIRLFTEYACAKSGLILKPRIEGGAICVDYIQADNFFPTAFDSSGRITGAVFSDQIKRNGKYYTRLEYHSLEEEYKIINRAFASDYSSNIGRVISLSSVEEWKDIREEVSIKNIEKPLFGYFKMPMANTVDASSPVGVSVYAKAVELIKEADKQYSRLLWEFESGERALFVDDNAFRRDKEGRPVLPDKRLYRTLADFGDDGLFKEWTPTLREENILRGLNAILRKIEYSCGLAYGTISDAQETDKTAEEIRASKQRSYATVCDIQKALKTALEDLVYSMDVLCTLYNLAPAGKYEVSFEFDDSIIADRKTEFAEKMQLVTMGVMKMWEFRMWYFGESEEEAKKAAGAEDSLEIKDA